MVSCLFVSVDVSLKLTDFQQRIGPSLPTPAFDPICTARAQSRAHIKWHHRRDPLSFRAYCKSITRSSGANGRSRRANSIGYQNHPTYHSTLATATSTSVLRGSLSSTEMSTRGKTSRTIPITHRFERMLKHISSLVQAIIGIATASLTLRPNPTTFAKPTNGRFVPCSGGYEIGKPETGKPETVDHAWHLYRN